MATPLRPAAEPPLEPPLLRQLARTIGNTPMLVIRCRVRGRPRTVYAKYEAPNLTGSIKDRMALHVVSQAYRRGALHPGDTIAEATSGNTGIAFAAIGRALGHPVRIYMPDWMSAERVALIRSYGATVVPISRDEGGFLGSIAATEAYAGRHPGVFLPRQFHNEANTEAHQRTTGPEIAAQLEARGLRPHAFVAGVGTGGTVMGVGRYLRTVFDQVRVHPLEPAESPTLTAGRKVGHHRIQGISDEFIPPIVELDELDEVVAVSDGDSILMAQRLAASLGLGVGISSGANFLGALQLLERYGDAAIVVTVFADDNTKYLSTALLADEAVRDDYLSPHVELTGLETQRRACRTCVDVLECELTPAQQAALEHS